MSKYRVCKKAQKTIFSLSFLGEEERKKAHLTGLIRMTKLTEKPQNSQDVMQLLKASVTPLEEKLMELFSASKKSFLAEEAMEERISALVQDFLYAKTASTDIDLELIIQEFTENKIPALPA